MRDRWATFLAWWAQRPEGLRRWTQVTRTRAVVAGVFLVGVPAFFSVFPSWAGWNVWIRSFILVAWVIVALGAVAASLDADNIVRRLSREKREEESRLLSRSVRVIVSALMVPGTQGFPRHYDNFTIYLYSKQTDELEPWYPKMDFRDEADPRIFKPGNGATGCAWESETDEIVVVRGSEVANGKYDLTEAQQKYYSPFESVASVSIWGSDARLGVLTLLSRQDSDYFETPQGQHSLRALSETLGVVLKVLVHRSSLDV